MKIGKYLFTMASQDMNVRSRRFIACPDTPSIRAEQYYRVRSSRAYRSAIAKENYLISLHEVSRAA